MIPGIRDVTNNSPKVPPLICFTILPLWPHTLPTPLHPLPLATWASVLVLKPADLFSPQRLCTGCSLRHQHDCSCHLLNEADPGPSIKNCNYISILGSDPHYSFLKNKLIILEVLDLQNYCKDSTVSSMDSSPSFLHVTCYISMVQLSQLMMHY